MNSHASAYTSSHTHTHTHTRTHTHTYMLTQKYAHMHTHTHSTYFSAVKLKWLLDNIPEVLLFFGPYLVFKPSLFSRTDTEKFVERVRVCLCV